MVDTRGGAFTVGLGVVPGISVIPRVDTWSADKVHRTIDLAPRGLFVVGLPTGTAVVRRSDGSWRAVGSGRVLAYRDGVEVSLDEVRA
jgi:cyanophycinase